MVVESWMPNGICTVDCSSIATIEIRGIDRSGMLHDISDVLSDQLGINIRKITISSDNGIFDGTIEMQVHDRKDVQFIVENMKNIKDVQEVLEVL